MTSCLLIVLALQIPQVYGHTRAALTHKTADIIVKGRIKDALTNESLTGCTVVIKGSQRGTTTDANGDYSIS
ncbi:MAG: hypothetical protein EOO39_45935, partial [Cytophagaceae bacterium]